MRNRVRGWLRKLNARYLAVALVLLLAAFFAYFWHLATLTPGLSPAESAARHSSVSIHGILINPVNAPQRLLQYLAQKVGYHEAFSMRLASVIFAIFFIGCIFWLMRAWFGLAISAFGTLMFASTPLIILMARSAEANILLLTPLAVLMAYVWLTRRVHRPGMPWLYLVLISVLSLYVPGMAWLLLIGCIAAHKRIIELMRLISTNLKVVGLLIVAAGVSPLVYALSKNPSLYHNFLLIPHHWSGAIGEIKSIVWAALALIWRTRDHVPLIVGRLPLLDILQISMAVFGGYVMWARARREMIALISIIALGVVLAGLNNNVVLLGIALPALALLSAAGLRYLYVEWRGIFPHNPLPLGLALILISTLVGLQVAYGVRYSLVAWPHTTATKNLYVLK